MIKQLALLLFLSLPLISHAGDIQLFIAVLECESGGHSRDPHGKPIVGDKGLAKGIAQFHEDTFHQLAKKAHMKNMHWLNPVDQMKLLAWAMEHNYGPLWSCYRRAASAK